MDKLLVMNQITKSFYGVNVLKGVDFDLGYGEVHVLLGENGAGKSTLMKILCGAYTLDSGSISIAGTLVDLAGYDPRRAEDAGIVTVYQNFHLVPHLSVAENLSLPQFTRQRGLISWKRVNEYAREALRKVDFAIDPRTKVRDLPVSQRQMLEIAIALSKNAKIIIMDEPTAALSRKETETLFKTIGEITAQRIGLIYISHKLEEVKQVGDRITVLRDGLKIATLENSDADLNRIITLMIGKEVSRASRETAVETKGVALEARGLRNERFTAPISFSVRKGEILGVTGLVGSGKTELARALFGIDRLADGVLLLDGKHVRIDSPKRAVDLGIGYLSEDRDTDGLCLNLGVKENVSIVFLAKLRSLFFSLVAEKQTVNDLVVNIGLKIAGLSQHVKYLSGGNKQKVVFGKWLTARCRLLILDEPTTGIDVGARADIYGLIRRFVQEEDRAVVFISSDVDEILEVSDRILVMVGGETAAVLDSSAATKQEIMRYSTHVARGAG